MKTVLHIIDTTGPGGAETVFINLASQMRQRGYHSIVVIRGKGWVYEQLLKHGFDPIILDMKGSFDHRFLRKLIALVKTHNVDLIQSHLLGSNIYSSVAGWLTRTPVISTFHGFVDVDSGERFRWLKFFLVNLGSKYCVFVSEFLKKGFWKTSNISKRKSTVIYNGIDVERFQIDEAMRTTVREELGVTDQDIVVGSVGNIRPAKGYEFLLDAAAILKERGLKLRFVVIGAGGNELHKRLEEKRQSLALEQTVEFIGFRESPEKYLTSFDIFLLSSSSEGFSISTIEAMSVGIPVICTASGGPEEIVEHGKTGLLVKPESAQAIADGIQGLLEEKTVKRTELVTQAKLDVKAKYSLEAMLNKYEQLYLHCI